MNIDMKPNNLGDNLKKDSIIGMNHNMNDNIMMASNMNMSKKKTSPTINMQNMKGM